MKKGTYHLNEIVGKKNIILLSYYRNNLVHLFIKEAFISCSLFGFGDHLAWKQGVDRQELWEKTLYISTLLGDEFVVNKPFRTIEDFNETLLFMMKNNTLTETVDGNIAIHPKGENHVNFLNTLLWPFIDTYWVTFVFIFSLIPSKFVQESKMYEKVQWFAQSLFEDQIMSFYESCSQEIIKNAVNTFVKHGIIIKQKLQTISDGVKDESVYTLGDEYNDEDKMQQLFEKLSHYRKTTLVKMTNMTSIRKTLLSDFPFMAKM